MDEAAARTRRRHGRGQRASGRDEEGDTDMGVARMRGTTGWQNEGGGTDEAARTRGPGGRCERRVVNEGVAQTRRVAQTMG